MKKIIIAVIIIIIGLGAYFLLKPNSSTDTSGDQVEVSESTENEQMEKVEEQDKSKTIIGTSVEERDITAYHFFQSEENLNKEILFVGGIHGGYSSNTSLVAYETIDYLQNNLSVIPTNVKVTVIPSLNPDGVFKVIGKEGRFESSDIPTSIEERIPGRFNANNVDLNRNFDCDWQEDATWQDKSVSGGANAFSEPESSAVKNYIEANNPNAVVVWYSSAGGVFASSCHDGVLPETEDITSVYAKASGYKEYKSFDFYEVTGDMVNWLAKEKIPAISVLLSNHESTDWSKNKEGVKALLSHYAE